MPMVQERPPAAVQPAEDSIDIKLKQLEKLKLEIEIEQMRTSLQQQRDVSQSGGGQSKCCDRGALTCVGTEQSRNVNNNNIDIRGYKSSRSQTINCNALGSSGSCHKYLDTGNNPETKIVNGKDDFYKSRAYVHDQQQHEPTSIENFPNTSAGSDGNSVGRLQEFCMKRGASPPRYNERSAGAGLFSVECVWSDIVTLGRATNKKEAKRRAAAEMLSKLSGTRSSQGSNNLASRNGDVRLGVSKCYEKNYSTRNIKSPSS